jgi:hypothetical protein
LNLLRSGARCRLIHTQKLPLGGLGAISSDDMMIDVSVEVTDLVTNEVLLVVKDGDVTTRHCGVVWKSQTVFEQDSLDARRSMEMREGSVTVNGR